MGEFGEPWVFDELPNGCYKIHDCRGDKILRADMTGIDFREFLHETLAERAVICINFLAGVPTEDLEVLMKHPQRSHVHAIMEVAKRMREGHSGD